MCDVKCFLGSTYDIAIYLNVGRVQYLAGKCMHSWSVRGQSICCCMPPGIRFIFILQTHVCDCDLGAFSPSINAHFPYFAVLGMSLWAKAQHLPPENLGQIYNSEQFPIEVRHYLAPYIEEKFW